MRTVVGLSHHEPMPDSVDRHSHSFDSDVRIRTSCLILATSIQCTPGLSSDVSIDQSAAKTPQPIVGHLEAIHIRVRSPYVTSATTVSPQLGASHGATRKKLGRVFMQGTGLDELIP